MVLHKRKLAAKTVSIDEDDRLRTASSATKSASGPKPVPKPTVTYLHVLAGIGYACDSLWHM